MNILAHRFTRARFAKSALLAFGALTVASQPVLAQTPDRIEVHAVQTVTLRTQQILNGDPNGMPTVLAGELRIPKPGTPKGCRRLVLVHDFGGISSSHDRWAQMLNSLGVAVFILDLSTGRGIVQTIDDQSRLDPGAMMVDAYRASRTPCQTPTH